MPIAMRIPISTEDRPDKIESAEDIVDYLLPRASQILAEEGGVDPMLFVVRKDTVDFMLVNEFLEDNEKKSIFREFILRVCRCEGVEGVGLVTEGWMIARSNIDSLSTPVCEQPDRQEVLTIYGEWCDGTAKDTMVPFGRDEENNPILEDALVDVSSAGGALRGFFIPENRVLH